MIGSGSSSLQRQHALVNVISSEGLRKGAQFLSSHSEECVCFYIASTRWPYILDSTQIVVWQEHV